jgi:putative hemolysin
MDDVIKIIDIKKAIRSSKSKFVRSLPLIIVRLIEKIIHQDEMNATIHRYRNKTGVPFINDILNEWNVNVVVKGDERVPDSGRFVFVANHPVGGMDALAFLSTIHRFFPDVISPSNQLFNFIPNLHQIILGVNVFGTNTRETVEKFNQLFNSGSQIMIFPAGLVSRKNKGLISDLVWQKSFVSKSVQYKRDIIPVHISGRNSNLFYFVANFRKFLGIKISIEIILLPNEMMKQRNSSITLRIGEVIPWKTFTSEKSQNDWAQYVKEEVYKLADS